MTAEVDAAGAFSGLDAVFRARSIALVGISADTRKMTGAPLDILRQVGFAGTIYPVNPRYRDICGLPCFPGIDALPATPDVALIMHGARSVAESIRACDFGPVLAIGSGGITVKLYRDIAYVPLPAERSQVLRALQRLKLRTLLQGFRGRPAGDIDGLVDVALAFGAHFVAARPEAAEMELNPVFVRAPGSTGGSIVAVDVLVKFSAI